MSVSEAPPHADSINASGSDLTTRPEQQRSLDHGFSEGSRQNRLAALRAASGAALTALDESRPIADPETLRGNIEHYIGLTQIPTGVMGPLPVHGTAAKGSFYVPLATTEGALVASFNRGAKAIRLAGGATSVCLQEGVQRAPVFKFADLHEATDFVAWIGTQRSTFERVVSATSRYARLNDVRPRVEGNQVTVVFEYHPAEAAGQNMATVCTDAICAQVLLDTSVKPDGFYIEGNFSGDKKATAVNLGSVRGKRVSAEVFLPRRVLEQTLLSTADAMLAYGRTACSGAAQSGALGVQGHYANGLAALYLACGQDVACVAESHIGVTRFEPAEDGGLYAAITLPCLLVGTVGGGTRLPTQADCLALLGCEGGPGSARKFAEICAAVVLAGELSISAAIANGHFASAHRKLGRPPKP